MTKKLGFVLIFSFSLQLHAFEGDLDYISKGDPVYGSTYLGDVLSIEQLLFKERRDPNVPGPGGYVALHEGVFQGFISIIKLLIKAGAKVNIQSERGDTPLHLAAGRIKGAGFNSYLRNAIHGRHMTSLLLDADADPNIPNNWGRVPLHYAAMRVRLRTLTLLLRNGAKVNISDNSGNTPFHKSMSNSRAGSVKHIKEIYIALQLIHAGAGLEAPNLLGEVPLHIAARTGHKIIAQRLLQLEVDINVQDKDLSTPLIEAVVHEQYEMVRFLIKQGADVDIPDIRGNTALHLAVLNENPRMTRLLLESGARTDIPNEMGQRAIEMLPKKAKRNRQIQSLFEKQQKVMQVACNY